MAGAAGRPSKSGLLVLINAKRLTTAISSSVTRSEALRTIAKDMGGSFGWLLVAMVGFV